jgi:hypothetical protein
MRKVLSFIKSLIFSIKIIATAVVAPVVGLIHATLQAQPISTGHLVFAFWRLLVWSFFLLCAIASIGVPPLIALLFLIDLGVVGLQIVHNTVLQLKEST